MSSTRRMKVLKQEVKNPMSVEFRQLCCQHEQRVSRSSVYPRSFDYSVCGGTESMRRSRDRKPHGGPAATFRSGRDWTFLDHISVSIQAAHLHMFPGRHSDRHLRTHALDLVSFVHVVIRSDSTRHMQQSLRVCFSEDECVLRTCET